MQLLTRSVCVIVFVLIGANGYSQSTEKKDILLPKPHIQINPSFIDDGKEVTEPFDGTYQFIFTRGIKQIFTDEILKVIDANRKDDETVTLTLSPYAKLKILSRRQITAAGFMPFTKSYIFENPND